MTPEEALARLEAVRSEALAAFEAAAGAPALRDAELRFLGRKGPLSAVMSTLGTLPSDERREVGRVANEVRSALESALAERRAAMDAEDAARRLQEERIDVTLPGRRPPLGRAHPI